MVDKDHRKRPYPAQIKHLDVYFRYYADFRGLRNPDSLLFKMLRVYPQREILAFRGYLFFGCFWGRQLLQLSE